MVDPKHNQDAKQHEGVIDWENKNTVACANFTSVTHELWQEYIVLGVKETKDNRRSTLGVPRACFLTSEYSSRFESTW